MRKGKICKYHGCEYPVYGGNRAEYCQKHSDEKYRSARPRKGTRKLRENEDVGDVGASNQVIRHHLYKSEKRICVCNLPGCDEKFEIIVIPRIYVYAARCPRHRNEYKSIRDMKEAGVL